MAQVDIVVASRARAFNMPRILSLLPEAKVFVDEREEDDYLKVVPKEQLFLHAPTETCNEMRRLQFSDTRFSDLMCSIDDDFSGITMLLGRRVRTIKDPDSIKQIVVNGAMVAHDIGSPLFCWSRKAHPGLLMAHNPINFVGPCAGAWGHTRPAGQRVMPDVEIKNGGEDVDCTLQALLEDRIVYTDNRFYFMFGGVGEGRGGNQVSRTQERELADQNYLLKKWPGCLDFGQRSNFGKKTVGGGRRMSINVTRKNSMVDMK